MSVGPCYRGTAQLGVVGKLCWGGAVASEAGGRRRGGPGMCALKERGTGTWHGGLRRHARRKGCCGHRGASAPAGDELRQRRCQLAGRRIGRWSWVEVSGGGRDATVMSQGSIPRRRRAWATCARISRLAPSRAALLCLQEDHRLAHPHRHGETAREDGRSGRRGERSPPASPASPASPAAVPGCPAPPV